MKELTMLFYFASDNPLAPLVVSEIKAIKDAGFQEDTNVLVYFDPMEKGARTQLYDVNRKRKKEEDARTSIGDGRDPFVRNLSEDEVDFKELTPKMQAALTDSSTVKAVESLGNFIDFAITKRQARNYMLFLVGHGMIVANDTFLPDDDPVSAVTLLDLQELCSRFTKSGGNLHLLGLHSCSMSSIEVAYQLQGLAGYMLATQGTSFVNGWPYRQLLKKTLNQISEVKDGARKAARNEKKDEQEVAAAVDYAPVNYPELVRKLYFLCLFNFTDFITAGYSCDLVLCSLDPKELEKLKEPLQGLAVALREGIKSSSAIKDLVLLAHWESQSFWSENYTDLWDFCFCLGQRCQERARSERDEGTVTALTAISTLCRRVRDVLVPEKPSRHNETLVRHADNFGSEFQFARGLSIYFPWCEPLDDQRAVFKSPQNNQEPRQREAKSRTVLANYERYAFTIDFNPASWLSFLEAYFDETKRKPRYEQKELVDEVNDTFKVHPGVVEKGLQRAKDTFVAGVLKRTPELEPKRTPEEGDECTCPTIKNYPTTGRKSPLNIKEFSITPRALKAFLPFKDGNESEVPNPE